MVSFLNCRVLAKLYLLLLFGLMVLPMLSICASHEKYAQQSGKGETATASVSEYYTTWGKEEVRLKASPVTQLERMRTESILQRNLPKPPAVIYDIGGGPGSYAFPLAKNGYRVHLIDITPLHIQKAEAHMKSSGIHLEECAVGTALAVKAVNMSADIVLLMGPLYHLQNKMDRLAVLKEAQRILKPGGIIFAAAFTRASILVHVVDKTKLQDASSAQLIADIIKTGKSAKPIPGHPFFDLTYFHSPDELEAELQAAGFCDVRLFCVEGPEIAGDALTAIGNNPDSLKEFLHLLELIENDRSIMGASGHILAIGKK